VEGSAEADFARVSRDLRRAMPARAEKLSPNA
jgi:hypothetical protein